MLREILIAAGLLFILLTVVEIGFRIGRGRKIDADPRAGAQIGAVQGAALGLLALLLGFSFAAAGTRFLERQDLITTEANAIGTAYLRADMLDEPFRSNLRTALKQYTDHRIQVSAALRHGLPPETLNEIDAHHKKIWKAASDGANAKPASMIVVLPPVNEVIDIHSLRLAAGKKHVPPIVLSLLFGSSVLSLGVMGYTGGVTGRRHAILHGILAFLIGITLWTIIDLDYSRLGLLQLSDAPLKAIKFD